MKNLLIIVILISVLGAGLTTYAQTGEVCYNPNLVKDSSKKSIKSIAEGRIGPSMVNINYHSPGVRKRIIWGGLVPFDEVWVTGAHDATTINFDKDMLINNQRIEAGKYALFTIPGEKEWIVIINKNFEQHLASEYDEKDDVIRINVRPQTVDHLERLQYFIEPGKNNTGSISVVWEKKRISFPVQVVTD